MGRLLRRIRTADRWLLHPWTSRVSNGAFILGAFVFVVRVTVHALTSEADAWTPLATVLMAVGLVTYYARTGAVRRVATGGLPEVNTEAKEQGAKPAPAVLPTPATKPGSTAQHIEPLPDPSTGDLKRSLQKALKEGRGLLPATAQPLYGLGLVTGTESPQDSVEAWIAWVAWLLRDNPVPLQRFRREPPKPIWASVALAGLPGDLRRRLEQRLANLDEILRSL